MDKTRRAVLKKLAYVTPAILTLAATPAFAGKGSSMAKQRRKLDDTERGWGMGKIEKRKLEEL